MRASVADGGGARESGEAGARRRGPEPLEGLAAPAHDAVLAPHAAPVEVREQVGGPQRRRVGAQARRGGEPAAERPGRELRRELAPADGAVQLRELRAALLE